MTQTKLSYRSTLDSLFESIFSEMDYKDLKVADKNEVYETFFAILLAYKENKLID
jgi:hypothetical protein